MIARHEQCIQGRAQCTIRRHRQQRALCSSKQLIPQAAVHGHEDQPRNTVWKHLRIPPEPPVADLCLYEHKKATCQIANQERTYLRCLLLLGKPVSFFKLGLPASKALIDCSGSQATRYKPDPTKLSSYCDRSGETLAQTVCGSPASKGNSARDYSSSLRMALLTPRSPGTRNMHACRAYAARSWPQHGRQGWGTTHEGIDAKTSGRSAAKPDRSAPSPTAERRMGTDVTGGSRSPNSSVFRTDTAACTTQSHVDGSAMSRVLRSRESADSARVRKHGVGTWQAICCAALRKRRPRAA